MEKITHQERLKPWMGFVFFAVVMAVFIRVCVPLQGRYGIPGLVATELILLGLSIIYCLIRRVSLKEVFPIKKITVKDFFGCVILLVGVYMLSILSVIIMEIVYPPCAAEAEGISDMLYGDMNYISTIIVVALLPAVCEESVYRGAILSSFRGMKREWVAITLVGLFFSINHLSILRGPFTWIFGMALAYVVVKRNNILLTVMMHFMVNSFSATLGYIFSKIPGLMESAEASSAEVGTDSLGIIMIFACAAPVLLVTGAMLIDPKGHKAKRYIWAGILTAVLFVGGIVCTGIGVMNGSLMSTSAQYQVESEGQENSYGFTVEEERDYTIVVTMMSSSGDYHILVVNTDDGSIACEGDMSDGSIKTYSSTVSLDEGNYCVTIYNGSGSEGEEVTASIRVQ